MADPAESSGLLSSIHVSASLLRRVSQSQFAPVARLISIATFCVAACDAPQENQWPGVHPNFHYRRGLPLDG